MLLQVLKNTCILQFFTNNGFFIERNGREEGEDREEEGENAGVARHDGCPFCKMRKTITLRRIHDE
jgi:hypothetical protein